MTVDHVAPACASQRTVCVRENRLLAKDTYLLSLDDPEMARDIRPGQFLMIRPGPGSDPLLGRPFALYDVRRDSQGQPIGVDVVYLVMGRGTAELTRRRAGDRLEVWGPLGNGFAPLSHSGPVAFVAGGIGQTPFLALAKWWTGRETYGGQRLTGSLASTVRMYYGTRSADLLAGLDDFESAGIDLKIATNDGS
ncbi:MAG TPA: dihydroorotate dehydrogenase electron transfer subunit, partial [Isosphaeraceae bacterium]|nr:dihydroorotate dehydrogenase electron transfer subunit [Isosphaeraceae bacterium]